MSGAAASPQDIKVCRICKAKKVLFEFVKSKKFKNGYDTICLQCSRVKVKNWRRINKRKQNRKHTTESYRSIILDALIKRDGFKCGICKQSLENSKIHFDHIIPVALGGLDILENIQLTHPKCNMDQANGIRKLALGY